MSLPVSMTYAVSMWMLQAARISLLTSSHQSTCWVQARTLTSILVWTFHLIFFLLHSFLERIARCGISMDVGQSDDLVWWDILLLRFLCNDVECFMVLVLWFSALIGRLDVWRNQQLEDRKCRQNSQFQLPNEFMGSNTFTQIRDLDTEVCLLVRNLYLLVPVFDGLTLSRHTL